ncbi:MAG: PKD domain-containing protein [Bacteroidota bacterium]
MPTAGFSFNPSTVSMYETVTFTNSSTDADSYTWNFGDGTTSTDENPTHVYETAGSFTVKLTASNADGENEAEQSIVVADLNNHYVLDGTTYTIDDEMFWYQSGMGGDPYLRLLTTIPGQDNPDLLKLYPNMGLNELPGTYTWDNSDTPPAGTYDVGYTAGYAGMAWDWIGLGKTGSGNLVITEMIAGIYKIEGAMLMSMGNYNDDYEFVETSSGPLTLEYVGAITPLEK